MTRVLHLVSGLRVGGKERVALELCKAARSEGHDDRIAVFEHAPGGDGELDPGDVPVHAETVAPTSLRRVRRLARLVAALEPVVLHAHNDTALFLSSALPRFGQARRLRRVTTLHNQPVHVRARDRRVVRALSTRQDTIVCVSEELRRARVGGGWIPNAEVVHNGVDLGFFSPSGPRAPLRKALSLGPDALLIGMVARFDVGKRHADLIDAAASLVARGVAAGLVFAGDGPARQRVLASAPKDLPLHCVPHAADVPGLLRALDVCVLATDHEGLPMGLLEAMASGVPVVASDVGGLRELLGDPPVGALVPPGSVGELAAALEALRDDETRRAQGRAVRARVEECFSLDRTIAAYSHIWDA